MSALVLGAVSAMSALVTAIPATAAPTSPMPAGGTYVALGSSFAAGPGVAPIVDPECGRSSSNYPSIVADALGLNLVDVSCSGATIDNVIDSPQTTFPFTPTATPRDPQIQAVTSEIDLVTVTIGGNDVNYLLDLYRNSCTLPKDPVLGPFTAAVCTPVNPAATQAALDGLTDELVAMVEVIQATAPGTRIVLVDYVTILPQNGQACPSLPLTKEEIRYSLDVARQLQLATKHAAQRTSVQLAELAKASRHHDVCSSEPWVAGWVVGTPVGTQYHHNAAGMQAAAHLIIGQLL
jgi:hypothetical protein